MLVPPAWMEQTIEQFEADLKGNLYRIWNRMSSGSLLSTAGHAPSPFQRRVAGSGILGVPTVADRVAQMVVKQMIEPDLDAVFLPDSYGYRPGQIGAGCRGGDAQALLGVRLGSGIRHQRSV